MITGAKTVKQVGHHDGHSGAPIASHHVYLESPRGHKVDKMVGNRARPQGGYDGGHLDMDTRLKSLLIRRVHRVGIMVDTTAGTHNRHAAVHQDGNTRLAWRRALGRGHKVGMVAGTRAGTQGGHGGGH